MERYQAENSKLNIMSKAQVEDNIIINDDDDKSYYSDWRDDDKNLFQALK